MPKSLSAITGMKHRGTEALVASLPEGEPLRLVREPENPYDPNAVQVWARGQHVAYIKATQARAIAHEMDLAKVTERVGKLSKSAGRGWPMVELDS